MSNRKQVKRGAVTKRDSVFVGLWLPANLVAALDSAVAARDMDRSKLIREAVRIQVDQSTNPLKAA